MAIGFTPKYTEDLVQDSITQQQFLMLALYTAQELNWDVQYFSNSGLIAYTSNGMFKFNAQVKVILDNNTAKLLSTSTGNEFYDLGKNKKTVKQFTDRFEEVKHAYSLQELDARYEEIRENIIPDSQDIIRQPEPTGLEIFGDFISIFKPTKNYFFTPILLNINLLVFIAMALSGVHMMTPAVNSLLQWGANYKPLTLSGEWWRLITCCFVHIGILHLLMNMYALLYIGLLIEPILGRSRFIIAYMVTGVIASLTSLWWHDISVSAGASGAIFGMYGVFLALLTTNIVEKSTRKPLLISITIFVIYNLMSGMKEGVDNAAHIGGIVSGIIIGYLYLPSLKKNESAILKNAVIAFLITATALLTFLALKKIPNNIGKYDEIMSVAYTNDTTALTIYRMNDSISKEDKLSKINDIAIAKTKDNIRLIAEVEKLDLPEYLRYKTVLFNKYFELRLNSFELYYKAINEESGKYDTQLNIYYKQIDSINKKME